MADVFKIVDNNGTEFDIKDAAAREEIGNLENLQTTAKSNLVAAINEIAVINNAVVLSLRTRTGYSATAERWEYSYSVGKICFAELLLDNLSGNGIGTTSSTDFADISPAPLNTIITLGFDYISGKIVRLRISSSGLVTMMESGGVQSGNNAIRIPMIFII